MLCNMTGRNIAVQSTNDYSVLSKSSTVQHGYFRDAYLQKFVGKRGARRSPLIHRGYHIRMAAIDFMLKRFLKRHAGQKTQVLSLGAGFDTAFFRLSNERLLQDTVFYEIDFPLVVRRKADIIRNDENLWNAVGDVVEEVGEHGGVHSSTYHLMGVDLRDLSALETALTHSRFDFDTPTLILSECVLVYMRPSNSDAIIRWCASKMSRVYFVLYEQIIPSDAFGKFMMGLFHQLGSPLQSIAIYPTLGSQRERFQSRGWQSCEAMDMNQFYSHHVSEEEKRTLEKLEPFDEVEGWHQTCSHYVLLCAASASAANLLPPLDYQDENPPVVSLSSTLVPFADKHHHPSQVQRYGHASARVASNVVTIGGFGCHSDGTHGRSSVVTVTDLIGGGTHCADGPKDVSRMHHSCSVLADDSLIVIGGRSSPWKPCAAVLRCTLTNHPPDKNVRSNSHRSMDDRSHEKPLKANINSPNCDADIGLNVQMLDTKGSNFTPRWRHSAVVFRDSIGDERLIVYGGRTLQEAAVADLWCLDVTTLVWTQIGYRGDDPGRRQSHSACTWGRWMVLAGGTNEEATPQHTVHLLDLYSYEWKRLDMDGQAVPRYSHSCVVHGDILMLVGGVNLSPQQPPLTLVNLHTGASCHYSLPECEDIIFYHSQQSVFLDSSHLLLIGGGENCFSFGTHFNQSPLCLDISPYLKHFLDYKGLFEK